MNGPYWIKQWIGELSLLNEQFRKEDGSVDFDALGREEYAFRTAIITRKFEKSPRAKKSFTEAVETYNMVRDRASKGGKAKAENSRKEATTPCAISTNDNGHGAVVVPPPMNKAPRKKASSAPCLPSWQDVLEFVNDRGLDYTDAREWYEMTVVDRNGHDKDGNRIANLKASLVGFCKVKEGKRRITA